MATLMLAGLPAAVRGQSGLQITPDSRRVLVSKDVGAERWAIAFNRDDESVTGNIYLDSGEPQFVWCASRVPGADPLQLTCYGATSCPAAPCSDEQWANPIAFIELARSFFEPRPSSPSALHRTLRAIGDDAGTPRPAGVQVSRDARRLLLSKDVDGQRWTIALNLDDRTVTGNVFTPGGEPSFLWCEQTRIAGDQVTLSCSGAPPCAGGSCAPADWRFVSDVTLSSTFFRPPLPAGDPRSGCVDTASAGDFASAAALCADVATADPTDGEVALIRAVAEPLAAAFESGGVLAVLRALGVSVRGSTFDVCKIDLASAPVENEVPRAATIQQVVTTELLRISELASSRLADVPTSSAIPLSFDRLPLCQRPFETTTVEVDATDVRAAMAAIELSRALAHVAAAYDVDFDVRGAIDASTSFFDLVRTEPRLLTLQAAGIGELRLARSALDDALGDFLAAIDLAAAETDDQSDDVLVLGPDGEDVDETREIAQKLRTSLERPVTFTAEQVSLDDDQRLVLAHFFEGRTTRLRDLLPLDDEGEGDVCALPDPTLGGIAPDLEQKDLNQLLQLACDG